MQVAKVQKEATTRARKPKILKVPAAETVVQKMSPQEAAMDNHIRTRFKIMDKLTEMTIKGQVRSMIISGAAGIGKSYSLEKRLTKAIDEAEINSYTVMKGRVSAIGLFKALYDHRFEGDVLVLDDIDGIFQDETSLNLLKGALDTGDIRKLVWLTASHWLADQGVDQEFEFNGACIFITNMDFDRMLERGTVLAPHLRALMNRAIYLDLGIHENQEILMRIKQVIETTSMLDIHGIDDHQKQLMLRWMDMHYDNLRELSLRTVLKLGSFMKGDPQGWQDIAEATMIRNSSYYIKPIPQAALDAAND